MIHRRYILNNRMNQSIMNQKNEKNINKKNNREKTSYLKPSQYNIIWNVSWLSLSSSLYAVYKGHYNLAFIPGGVF
jgi:hypothetical protein